MKELNIFYYATIWSFIIGICCATYLNLINFIINLNFPHQISWQFFDIA